MLTNIQTMAKTVTTFSAFYRHFKVFFTYLADKVNVVVGGWSIGVVDDFERHTVRPLHTPEGRFYGNSLQKDVFCSCRQKRFVVVDCFLSIKVKIHK